MNKTTDEETIYSNRNSPHPEDLEKSKSEEIPKTDNIKEERTDGLDDQTNLLPTKQVILVFLGLSAALFCSLLDQTIVSTILPSINHEFNAANEGSWVATSYLLTSTAFMPIHSRLSDLIGRKTVLQVCLALFFIGSLACAVSKTIEELIVFRAIAGVGGGGILNNVMVSISDIVSLRERGKYQGILGVVVSVANSLGPLLGGVFTETIGWRWAFWINLPLTGVAILIVQFFLPFKRVGGNWREKARRIDYAGSIIILASTILILLPLNWGGNKYAWDSAVVLALLIIGLLLIVVFILVENCKKIVDLPILPMHLFKNRSVSASYTCTFFSGCIFYGALYYLPQYLQVVAGYSPLKSGVTLLALILSQSEYLELIVVNYLNETFFKALFSFTAGLIVSKTGNYMWNIWTGFMLWTIGLGLLTTLRPDTKLANFIGYCVIAGVGAGNTFQTTLLSVQAAVSRQDMAVATGGRNFIRMLGGTISLALCDTIVRNTLIKGLRNRSLDETTINEITTDPTSIGTIEGIDTSEVLQTYCNGIRNAFILFTACSGASFLISLLIKQYQLERPDDKVLKEEGKAWAEEHKAKKRAKKGVDVGNKSTQ